MEMIIVSFKQLPPVPGYKVLISQPLKDEVIDCSSNSPTKLIRLLMNVYFTPDVLAVSSCFGSRKFQCLDKEIILACLSESPPLILDSFIHFHKFIFFSAAEFVTFKHPNVLVDAINDKCANYRRKWTTKSKLA